MHQSQPDASARFTWAPRWRVLNLYSWCGLNRAFESKCRNYKVATSDGRFFTGMVVEESAASVKLALADGQSVSILRSDIEEMQNSGLSFMPEGFEKSMTVQQAADLFEFVHPK